MVKNIPINEDLTIKTVAYDLEVAKVVLMGVPDVPGVAGRLFTNLSERGVDAEMIIQNNMRGGLNDIGFLVRKESLDGAIDVCRDFSRDVDAQGVSFNTEIARISVLGVDTDDHPDIPRMFTALAKEVFTTLAKEGINIDMISSTGLTVNCVVAASRAGDAARALREYIEMV